MLRISSSRLWASAAVILNLTHLTRIIPLPTQIWECNRQYLLNLLGLVGNICIGKLCIITSAQWLKLCFYYLPKFTILASMFVCRFVTCQNLHFGKYVRLSVCYLPKFTILASMFVCRFVCLSVRFVKHNSWTLWHIITKLGPHMEWVSSFSM